MRAEPRRYPSTVGGAVYLGILAAMVAGLVIVVLDSWRLGIGWVACALIAAAVARLVFDDADAGMLQVRGKALDFLLLAGTGLVLIALAVTIPNQPG